MNTTEARSDFYPTQIYHEGKGIVEDYKQNPLNYTDEQRAILETGMFLNLSISNVGDQTQVASLSRGLVWDREGYPGEMLAAIIEDIGGERVREDDWTGENSLAVTYEVDELDLDEIIHRFVYSPFRRYTEYMEHLAYLAEISDQVHAKSILEGIPGFAPKGETFKKIFNGEQTKLIRAYQKGSGAGFVWNSEKIVDEEGNDNWLAIPPEKNQPYPVRKLAVSEGTEAEISRSTLDGIDYFKGSSNRIRIRISGFFDASVDCCRNSAASQSDANFVRTDDILESALRFQEDNVVNVWGTEMSVSKGGGVASSENTMCNACGKDKFKEDGCQCEHKEQRN